MNEILFSLLSQIISSAWIIGEIIFIFISVFIIRRFKISGQKIALVGFALLFFVMVENIIGQDNIAGFIAEYVWIIFAISFIVQAEHMIHHEKN